MDKKKIGIIAAIVAVAVIVICIICFAGSDSQAPDSSQGAGNGAVDPSPNGGGTGLPNHPKDCAHDYGTWFSRTPATCLAKGEKEATCRLCGHVAIEEVPIIGCSYDERSQCKWCDQIYQDKGLLFDLTYFSDSSSGKGERCYKVIGYTGNETDLKIPVQYLGLRVLEIGDYAFKDCKTLNSVLLPPLVHSIGSYSFSGCSNLKTMKLPSELKVIGQNAFLECSHLITEVNGIRYVEDWVIGAADSVTEPVFRENIKGFADYAFWQHKGLRSVTIPATVRRVPKGLFCSCEELRVATIPATVTEIENEAFRYCRRLYEVSIPDGLKHMGSLVFADCVNLVSVRKPIALVSGSYYNAYDGCHKLVEKIGVASPIDGPIVHPGPTKIKAVNGYQFYKESIYSNEYVLLGYIGEETQLVLPESYEGSPYSIMKYAFAYNRDITSVVIPEGCTVINEAAFTGCSNLRSVSVPKSVRWVKTPGSDSPNFSFTYAGTVAEWEAISDYMEEPYKVYCTDGITYCKTR